MKNIDIDSFLRENKPQVQEDPSFLLEVQQKMRAVEGIKSEVDRQRKYGRMTILVVLFAGLACGVIATILCIDTWKHYLLIPVIGCAIALWFVIDSPKNASRRF